MFSGYNYFDYKYNIPGYSGQDYDNGRIIFMFSSLGLTLILLFVLYFTIKDKKKFTDIFLKVLGVSMTAFYVIKTTWESYFDITTGRGFNLGILPFDTCSIVMWAGLLSGFAKGKLKKIGDCWIATGGIVGGLSNILYLRALKYYPFFTFGAQYSMLWHFGMFFAGLWLIVSNYIKLDFKSVIYAFLFHMGISLIVIPFDYINDYDFMLYRHAGGAPLIEDLADILSKNNLEWVTTIIMIVLYFALFVGIIYVSLGIKKLIHLSGVLIKRITRKDINSDDINRSSQEQEEQNI